MKSLAVIGTGIAGMATAYLLRDRYRITVYEKNAYIGGHTNTVSIAEGSRSLPIDTGFMVYNDRTYPNLVRFFDSLGVRSKPTSMSFSVFDGESGDGANYAGLGGVFPTLRAALDPRRYRLLLGMRQLFLHANKLLATNDHPVITLAEFVKVNEISPIVVERFLLPMSAAIWSTPRKRMLEFPAATLFRFLKNHGMLGFAETFQWKTLEGGSQQYKDKILAAIRDRIHISRAAARMRRSDGCVEILDSDGHTARFDLAVVATHADQALALLERPTPAETQLLSAIRYNVNPVALHTDASVMPRNRKLWASWNYRYDSDGDRDLGSTHYWMNSLQGVSQENNYFVSVDYSGPLDAQKVKWRYVYEHPRFDEPAIRAQRDLPLLNENGPIYFCGSYFRYGFHEDAFTSALNVCRRLCDGKDPLS